MTCATGRRPFSVDQLSVARSCVAGIGFSGGGPGDAVRAEPRGLARTSDPPEPLGDRPSASGRRLLSLNPLAAVVKLVYTRRSGRRAFTGVEVRILSAASKRLSRIDKSSSNQLVFGTLGWRSAGVDRHASDRQLSAGSHTAPDEGACVLELASMLSGEQWSTHSRARHAVTGTVGGRDRRHRDRFRPIDPVQVRASGRLRGRGRPARSEPAVLLGQTHRLGPVARIELLHHRRQVVAHGPV